MNSLIEYSLSNKKETRYTCMKTVINERQHKSGSKNLMNVIDICRVLLEIRASTI